jgi:hypothetical protein
LHRRELRVGDQLADDEPVAGRGRDRPDRSGGELARRRRVFGNIFGDVFARSEARKAIGLGDLAAPAPERLRLDDDVGRLLGDDAVGDRIDREADVGDIPAAGSATRRL